MATPSDSPGAVPAGPAVWMALALGVLAGTAWQLQQPTVADAAARDAAAALAVAMLLALVLVRERTGRCAALPPAAWWAVRSPTPTRRAGRLAQAAVVAAATALLAFAATSQRAAWRLADRLPAALEGRDIVVDGHVASLPRESAAGTRFVFETDAAWQGGAPVRVPARLALGWWRGVDDDALLGGPPERIAAGQHWRLTVRLRRPHGVSNPHGFDTELWFFEQDLGAGGHVRATPKTPAVKRDDDGFYPVERLRQRVRDRLLLAVDDPARAGVLAALAIGDQAAIGRDDWDVFRVTGVAHLMSISGLHVTMLAWLAGAAVAALWRRHTRAPLWWPTPQAARVGACLAAAAYSLFAGWGVPAQRTVLMIGVVALLHGGARRWPAHAVLLAAAVAVALLDPWALLQPGFWLSFAAVGLLMMSGRAGGEAAGPWRSAAQDKAPPLLVDATDDEPMASAPLAPSGPRRAAAALRRAVAEGGRAQLVATIGLAPLSMLFFQQVSVVGLLANAVAIPLVTLLVVPLALAGVLLPPLWLGADALVRALMALLQALAALPGAQWTAAAAPGWAAALGVAAAVLALAPLPWRLRWLALPLALPLLAPPVARPADGRFETVVADVGQGTAVLVRTRGHLLLYDTGPSWSAESDAGARVLVPLLRARGERRIDRLVLSHRDTDHVGGAASVIAALPVALLSTTLAASHPLRARGLPHRPCRAGEAWTWDGVAFTVLHPLPAALDASDGAPGAAGLPTPFSGAPLPSSAATAGGATGAKPPIGGPTPLPATPLSVTTAARPATTAPRPMAAALRPNTLSCVVRVQGTDGRSLLLTGDIEAAQEAALVERSGTALASDVLLVPHHGSRTSSTPAFVDTVRPALAVVQAGYRSRFGHPAPAVTARYAMRGIALVRSDRCGALTVDADGGAHCERERARRYWHDGPEPVAAP